MRNSPSPLAGEGRGEGPAASAAERFCIITPEIVFRGIEPRQPNPSPCPLPQGERGHLSVTRARSLIGTRFRLHGRDPATGLDCVGLIVCAYPAILRPPEGYGLRGGTAAGFAAMFIANGMTQRQGAPCIGDVLLLQPSVAQFHLGVWSGESLIHADAVLRRVVETPGALAWPLASGWYFNVTKARHSREGGNPSPDF
jgi:murein DD-endopeptidase / murein LD-carboxypeptidase